MPFKMCNLALTQQWVDACLDYYRTRRPHLAPGMKTPAEFVTMSYLR